MDDMDMMSNLGSADSAAQTPRSKTPKSLAGSNGPDPSPKKRSVAEESTTGSSAKRARADESPCIIPGCGVARYCRMRFCKTHKSHYDCLKYRADHPPKGLQLNSLGTESRDFK